MEQTKIQVSIVGGSGYTGGEVLRLLLFHPHIEVKQITSERFAGKFAHKLHPNLRKVTNLKFSSTSELEKCDLLFLCLPHGKSMETISHYKTLAEHIIDLSGDFRLNSPELFETWYGHPHTNEDLMKEFVYGIPELHSQEMKHAKTISSAGCNATATILALYPLFKRGIVDLTRTVVEVKAGSSQAGNKVSEGSHHPERSGTVRSFKPTGHRHTAEAIQELSAAAEKELDEVNIHLSVTAIEMVRGVLATCHVFLTEELKDRDIWKIYREEYGNKPFIRIVKSKDGIHRYPEPKLLQGTNYCDIGFKKDENSNRLVIISAIDNLMKGAAGQAVQAMNLMFGFDENCGLEFCGLHPI